VWLGCPPVLSGQQCSGSFPGKSPFCDLTRVTGTSPENKPSPSSGRARRVDATRNRDALLAAARRLLDEHGPHVPLDEIAKAAEVANATLYRHFPTRADLIVAVYAEEVGALSDLSEQLLNRPDPGQALADWLRAFVQHVVTKRDLALALPDAPGDKRGALFADWHATMRDAAARLLTRAQADGTVRSDLRTDDLLALATGIALTGLPTPRLKKLLELIRHGYSPDDARHR
jgi:AcrR family transcriptional regulator